MNMIKIKSKSIKKQIILKLSIISILIFLCVEILVIERTYKSLYRALDASVEAHIKSLLSLIEIKKNGAIDFEFKDEIMNEYKTTKAFFILKYQDGKEIERSELVKNKDIELPFSISDLKEKRNHFWNIKIKNKPFRCAITLYSPELERESDEDLDHKDESENKKIDSISEKAMTSKLLLIVGLNSQDTIWRLEEIIKRTSMSILAGLILILAMVWIITDRSLRPFNKLKDDVKKITPNNLCPLNSPNIVEINSFIESFNELIEKLRHFIEKERQFNSDVAHELRTPISEMRTILEVGLKWKNDLTEEVSKNYEDLLSSLDKMQNIVISLLAISKYESRKFEIKKEKINLTNLLKNYIGKFQKIADSRNIKFKYNFIDDAYIFSDANLFQNILENIFSNAVEYSLENNEINIELTESNNTYKISISNYTKNLTKEDIPFIFDRFWRKDKARKDSDTHSGLGFSLVKSISDILNLSIVAELEETSLFTLRIDIPKDQNIFSS